MEASKIRRKSEKQLHDAVSLGRRSSSGLRSLEKHLEHNKEQLSDINAEFNQILARKESLERLAKTAEARLIQENANEKIQELESEIQIRQKAVEKVDKEIEDYKKSKSTTANKIHKQDQSKPALVTKLKESKVDSEKFQKKLATAEKREESANKALAKVTAKLEVIMAKKRKAAAKKAAAKRKAAAKKAAAKRKAAAKKAASKRKA